MKVREILEELSKVDGELDVLIQGEVSELSGEIISVGEDQEESGDHYFLIEVSVY